MCTRSQSRNNFPLQKASPAIVEPLHIELPFLEDQFHEDPPKDPPEVSMDDNRTMAEWLQAPTEGYEDAIVIPEIAANNFELKHGLINLVQNKHFFGHDKEDPHAHIPWIWLEKEPPQSILTWEDLVTKFINQFFPPSKTTNLRNEITRFQQRFDESFYEAWDRFNDLLRACPHHGFSELHQLDTFYNALNVNDQDSLNSAVGGNFLDKMPRECLKIIESNSKVRQSRAKAVVAKVSTSSSTPAISSEVSKLKDMVRALLLDKKNQSSASTSSPTPASVKAVELNCVTCGGTHSYQNCLATSGNVYRDNIQEYVSQAATAN
nr:reverse transcriptase domain-containing protein [Tanacetum cinerariifolium]